jgi:hypothetical protein
VKIPADNPSLLRETLSFRIASPIAQSSKLTDVIYEHEFVLVNDLFRQKLSEVNVLNE